MTREQMLETTAAADGIIRACLGKDAMNSFFLYAGAGSGKTGSLISALKWTQGSRRDELWRSGRRIGVITYTNAATDEIKSRLAYDPFIEVSTIHAFAWGLVEGFNRDIRVWLQQNLIKDVAELIAAQAKGRAGTKAAITRERSILSKTKRLARLSEVKRFVYSPTGEAKGRDALNHAEVIGISADFLQSKPVLQKILVDRFPILFVDESQDTNRALMDALLAVQHSHSSKFRLGLFGDTMQRIYLDGKVGLAASIPADWRRPAKLINYRCGKRILRLINLLRKQEDGQEQAAPEGMIEGSVRLFLANSETADRRVTENAVGVRMAYLTGKNDWGATKKTLILEHHMAASRMGFAELFQPLYAIDAYRTGLIDGALPELSVLTTVIAPLIEALQRGDKFAVARIVGKHSALVDAGVFRNSTEQFAQLAKADAASKVLLTVCQTEDLSIGSVLREIHRSKLFELPEIVTDALSLSDAGTGGEGEQMVQLEQELEAWQSVLKVPFVQISRYAAYTKEGSPFGTHQGVKGLEFPDVMVIVDDNDARGFLFSYEKLFGLKIKTEADVKNEAQGLETTIDRTRRLFYVTCSRAKESLAIVAYCSNTAQLRRYVLDQHWFEPNEVEEIS